MSDILTDAVFLTPNLMPEYQQLLTEIKKEIQSTRIRSAIAVNQELVTLYWHIGKQIITKQSAHLWGSKFIETLSEDLRKSFPGTTGFSVPNLKRMRLFAQEYPDLVIGSQPVSQLPWGHIFVLIYSVKDLVERQWYIHQAIQEGWSRVALERQIKSKLYERQGVADFKISNYLITLPSPQSQLAYELLKNPYNLDFLGLHDDALEREIELASVDHITKFLLELGKGFAFVGRQVPISLNQSDYYIDMLFYHLKLHAYLVIEIKATKFKPEHAGQLNFYLNLVDDYYKTDEDKPTIGLLLCKSHDRIEAEYALRGIQKPMGISEYELTKMVPDNFKGTLPSVEEIELELNNFITHVSPENCN